MSLDSDDPLTWFFLALILVTVLIVLAAEHLL